MAKLLFALIMTHWSLTSFLGQIWKILFVFNCQNKFLYKISSIVSTICYRMIQFHCLHSLTFDVMSWSNSKMTISVWNLKNQILKKKGIGIYLSRYKIMAQLMQRSQADMPRLAPHHPPSVDANQYKDLLFGKSNKKILKWNDWQKMKAHTEYFVD